MCIKEDVFGICRSWGSSLRAGEVIAIFAKHLYKSSKKCPNIYKSPVPKLFVIVIKSFFPVCLFYICKFHGSLYEANIWSLNKEKKGRENVRKKCTQRKEQTEVDESSLLLIVTRLHACILGKSKHSHWVCAPICVYHTPRSRWLKFLFVIPSVLHMIFFPTKMPLNLFTRLFLLFKRKREWFNFLNSRSTILLN